MGTAPPAVFPIAKSAFTAVRVLTAFALSMLLLAIIRLDSSELLVCREKPQKAQPKPPP